MEVAANIFYAVEQGMSYERAAEYAGVHLDTFRRWRTDGRKHYEKGVQSVQADFYVGLKNAERQGELFCLSIVNKVAKGGWKIKEEKTVEKTSDFEGDSTETSVTEKVAAPNWQAAMTLLERRYPKLYGRKVLELSDTEDIALKLRDAVSRMDKSIPTRPKPEDYFVDADVERDLDEEDDE
jgi:hypothetical protein